MTFAPGRVRLRAGFLLLDLLAASSILSTRWGADLSAQASNQRGPCKRSIPYGLDGGVQSLEKPKWLIPLFRAGQSNSPGDGKMIGTGIRVTSFALLAHQTSVDELRNSLREEKLKVMPMLLGFNHKLQFDMNSFRLDAFGFFPLLNVTVKHGIALYSIMRLSPPGRAENGTAWLDIKYPLAESEGPPLPLEWQAEQWGQHCFIQTWGQRGRDSSVLHLNEVTLKELNKDEDCHDYLCNFSTVTEDPGTSGAICGKTSFLGAPILCYEGSETKLSYVITGADKSCGRDEKGCATKVKALDLSKYSEYIWYEANRIQDFFSKNDFRIAAD